MTRAAIYTRISDDRSGEAAGVLRQREACEKLAADRGLDVVAIYEDNSQSAMTGKRPAYRKMLTAVGNGEIDCVIVWAADRLYRKLVDLLEITQVLGSVPVFAVKSGDIDLSTADGRLRANITGSVAQHESEKRSERVKESTQHRAKLGRFAGGQRRFGYVHSEIHPTTRKPTGPLVLVPAEAEAISWAYGHVLGGGSILSVKREWTRRGLRGPAGAAFTGLTVRDVLLRPLNAGLAVYDGQIVGKSDVPAIVAEETFLAARAILTDPRRRTSVGRPALSLLSGLLWCARCEGRMHGRYRHKGPSRGGGRVGTYACREGHVSRVRDQMDANITELVLARIERQADELRRPVGPGTDSVTASMRESETLRNRLDVLSSLVAAGDLDPVDYAAATRETRARLAAADAKITVATGRQASTAMVATGDVRAAWEAAGDDMRRTVLHEQLARVTVDRGTPGTFTMAGVTPDWRE